MGENDEDGVDLKGLESNFLSYVCERVGGRTVILHTRNRVGNGVCYQWRIDKKVSNLMSKRFNYCISFKRSSFSVLSLKWLHFFKKRCLSAKGLAVFLERNPF